MANGQDDVRMTLRVSRDSGRTWGPLTEVRASEDPVVLDNPGRLPAVCVPALYGARAELPRLPPDDVVMRCTRWRRLPLDLAREARERSASGCIDSAVQCQLSAREDSWHYGLLDDLEYGTTLWLRWRGAEVDLVELPDCPVVGPGPDREGCCLFAGHAEQHTWEEAHPVEGVRCTN